MTWQPVFPNELRLPLAPPDDLVSIEHGPGVVRCYTCGHTVWAHFQDGHGAGGCVASEAPVQTIEAALRGHGRKPLVGASGCLCPGWKRGQLPRALTKHLTPLTDDDDAACQGCEHRLIDHSEEQGCHSCPCTVHAAREA